MPTCGNFFWQDFQDYDYRIITFIHSYELAEFSEFATSEIGLPILLTNMLACQSNCSQPVIILLI